MEKDRKIKLADVACVDNRKMTGIEELAANIEAIGLLQPILLTTEPEDSQGGKTYGVVDGRRRFRALEQLKREYLEPGQYVIFQGKVGQEKQAAFSANFARQQLTLAEEVEALKNLGGSQASIAALLGKTEAWVALRQNLANLTGEWIKVLNDPEEYPQWTPAKLELVARETPEVQQEFEQRIYTNYTIAELKKRFAAEHRLISTFPFDIAACKECPKTTGAQGALFADYDAKKDRCLDLHCFIRKAVEFTRQRLFEPEICYPVRDQNGWLGHEDYELANEFKNIYEYEYKECRKPKKGEKPNAVVLCGEHIGEYRVAVPRKGQFDNPSKKSAAAPEERKEKTVAEREAALKAKRVKLALQKLKEWLDGTDNTFETWIARGEKDEKQMHEICLKLAMWYGIDTSPGSWGDAWYKPVWRDVKEFEEVVFQNAKRAWRNILLTELDRTLDHISAEAGPGICGLLFLDWSASFFEPAEREIPEPKSLIAARIKEQQAAREAAEKTTKPAKKARAKK